MEQSVVLKTFAVMASILVAMLPVASATNVNIIFNGATQQTADVSPKNLVNKQISIVHDPEDITWTNVKVLVTVNSASLAHTIEKIFIFKCGLATPVGCSNIEPISFETFANTELLWNDISAAESSSIYPQTANLMILVKLSNPLGQTSWMGFWDRITRTDFNLFNKFNFEQGSIDFFSTSSALVTPAKNFMNNLQMLPFNWATQAMFQGSLFALGANEDDFDIPSLVAAIPPGNTVNAINKDFFLVFSQTSSGVTNAITLNSNPSFHCGDNICDSSLGETSSSCCFDCGCSTGAYCNIASVQQPQGGVCRNESSVSLQILPPTLPVVTSCSQAINFGLSFQIANPPSSLPSALSAIVKLNNTPQTVSCPGQGNIYTCPLQIQPRASCGAGSFSLGPNAINVTLVYNDGSNSVTKILSSSVPPINVNFNCGCTEGFFCDAALLQCRPSASVSLSILNVTSFLPSFNPAGDIVTLNAKINNPPSDLAVSGVTYTLGTLFKNSDPVLNQTTGSITCIGGPPSHVYQCQIPISISNYNHVNAYFFRQNSISFSVTYSDVGQAVTRQLTSNFADITIPSFQCGDNVCNVGETNTNCCVDCGCPQSAMYCDVNRLSCDFLSNIGLQVLSVSPVQLQNCHPATPHQVDITAQVTNAPSNLNLVSAFYLKAGQVQGFPFTCQPISPGANSGLFTCRLTLPTFPQCQEQSQPFVLGPNALNFTVSFSNGAQGTVLKSLQSTFENIFITPKFTKGDGICESVLGENAANSCVDCPCEVDPSFGSNFFCDVANQQAVTGTCRNKNNIRLVIDSPTATVSFDTCEKAQKLKIRAHFENEPTQVLGTVFNGILNGTNAEFLSCQRNTQLFGGVPISSVANASAPVDCELRIPSIPRCTQGKTYKYEPNSIFATLAFRTAQGQTQIITIPGPQGTPNLPRIVTTQQVKSLFDITREAIQKFRERLNEIRRIARELLDWIQTCVDVAVILAAASIAAIFTSLFASPGVQTGAGLGGSLLGAVIGAGAGPLGAFAGAITGGAVGVFGGSLYSGTSIGNANPNNVVAVATAAQAIFSIWNGLCQLIAQQYQLQIQIEKIEISFIQSELCMDQVQHEIDIGACDGREPGCFNSMVGCLNFGQLDQGLAAVQNNLQQSGNILNNIGNSFQGFANLAPLISGGGSGTLSILQNNGALPAPGAACNRQAGVTTVGGFIPSIQCPGGNNDNLNIQVLGGIGCNFPVVTVSQQGQYLSTICQGSCNNVNYNIDTVQQEQQLTFKLFCFVSQQNFAASAGTLSTANTSIAMTIAVRADTNNNCICEASEGSSTGGVGGGTGTVQQAISALNAAQGQISTALNNLGNLGVYQSAVQGALQQVNLAINTLTQLGIYQSQVLTLQNAQSQLQTAQTSPNSGALTAAQNSISNVLTQLGSGGTPAPGGGVAPTVTLTTPNTLAANVVLQFSQSMNQGTVNVVFNPNIGTAGTWSGNTLTLTHTAPFAASTTYTVTVNGQSASGVALTGSSFTFTTGST